MGSVARLHANAVAFHHDQTLDLRRKIMKAIVKMGHLQD
jgi:hypothetical protein